MDFVNPTGKLKFESNETQKIISLQIIDDDITEVINIITISFIHVSIPL